MKYRYFVCYAKTGSKGVQNNFADDVVHLRSPLTDWSSLQGLKSMIANQAGCSVSTITIINFSLMAEVPE